MCRPIDFLYENVKEAKICFGYNLESIGPTTLRSTAKLRHFRRSFQRYPSRLCSFSSFWRANFRKNGCNPDPVNSWTVKILWVYLLYGSWFYNFMKISVKNDNRSWVIIANVLNMFWGSERVLIFRTLKFFQATQVTYSAI